MSLLFRGVNPATLLFYAFPACVSRIFKYKSLHGMRTSSHGGWNYYIPNFLLCFLVETRNKIDRPIPKIGIQIGERTHIHDQAIIPVNFSTTKTMAINTERYHPLGKLFLFIIFFSCFFWKFTTTSLSLYFLLHLLFCTLRQVATTFALPALARAIAGFTNLMIHSNFHIPLSTARRASVRCTPC